MRLSTLFMKLILLISLLSTFLAKSEAQNVTTFRPYEVVLTAQKPGSVPYRDGPGVSATFTGPGGKSIKVNGFWDGGAVWRIRFAPTAPGVWKYITKSSDRGMN